MAFTQAQLREAVGLSITTYRHWQETLAVLGGKTGRMARFSFGDLVALAALRCAVDDLGMKISQFAQSATALFNQCNDLAWIGDTRAYALTSPIRDDIRPASRRDVVGHTVTVVRGDISASIDRAAVVIPLDPLAEQLRFLLLGASPRGRERQSSLQFPPVPIAEQPHGRATGLSSSGGVGRSGKRKGRQAGKSGTNPR